jgi:hypothetical protein
MRLVEAFDTENNFWEANPQLKVAGPFKKVYTNDKSRNKENSSRLMWTVALIWDRGSKFYNQPESDKVMLLFDDHFGDPNYYKNNQQKVDELRDFYIKLTETTAERTLSGIEKKLMERDAFLNATHYDLGEKGDRGYVYGTVDTLDKMMANTKKLYDMYDDARKVVMEELSKGSTKGDATESLSDSGDI